MSPVPRNRDQTYVQGACSHLCDAMEYIQSFESVSLIPGGSKDVFNDRARYSLLPHYSRRYEENGPRDYYLMQGYVFKTLKQYCR